MEGTVVLAMAIAIPVILFPAAFVWYLNIGGLMKAYKEQGVAREATSKTK
ncbi:MAG TPA: hypothetical protein VGA85_02870 [Dehalococcoidales bacterium]